MKNTKTRIVFAIAISIILVSTGLSIADNKTINYSINPESVNREIEARGASIVVQELYGNEKSWQAVIGEIAKGNEAWLKIAIALSSASDAGASEMLSLAVGEALEHNPEAVLKNVAKIFGVSSVCGGPDIDDVRYNSYQLAIKAINKRTARVKAISDPSLRNVARECVKKLQNAKKGIASFYGTTNK